MFFIIFRNQHFSKPSNKMSKASWLQSPGSEPWSNPPTVTYNLISAPSPANQEPAKNLKLEFVNGFTVEDSRQNIFWSHNKDEIIYPAAALGIVMNTNTLKQRFFGTGANK